MTSRPTANIYVDGFNLYRQKIEHHPDAKWLDLQGTDPRAPIRQQTYIRALQSNAGITVHEGQFRNDKRSMPAIPISFDDAGEIVKVKVRKTEEKGSDVNLASYMIFDACRDDADLYVLVSNDSDFVTMLTILSEELDKKWALLSPVERPNSRLLALNPVFIKQIRRGALLASQLPEEIRSPEHGVLRRPDKWSLNENRGPVGPRTR